MLTKFCFQHAAPKGNLKLGIPIKKVRQNIALEADRSISVFRMIEEALT